MKRFRRDYAFGNGGATDQKWCTRQLQEHIRDLYSNDGGDNPKSRALRIENSRRLVNWFRNSTLSATGGRVA